MQQRDKEARIEVANLRKQIELMKREHQVELQNLEQHNRDGLEAARSDDARLRLKLIREQVREDSERLRQELRQWTKRANLAEESLHETRQELRVCNQEFRSNLDFLRCVISFVSTLLIHVVVRDHHGNC